MNKYLIAIAAAAAALVLGVLGTNYWSQQRAEAEVKEALRLLQSSFAKAETGPVEFNVWDRTLKISNIVLLPQNAALGAETKIGLLTASGVSSQGGGISADRVEFKDIVSTGSMLADSSATSTVEMPRIAIDGLAVARVVLEPAATDIAKLVRILAASSATSISIPQFTTTAKMRGASATAGVAPELAVISQTYFNTRLENLRDGRIGKMTVERSVMGMPAGNSPGTAGAMQLTGEFKDTVVTDYDVVALLAIADPAITPRASQSRTRIAGPSSVGAMSFKMGSLLNMSFASMTAGEMNIDIAKMRKAWPALMDSQKTSARGVSPQQSGAALEAMSELYESVDIASFEGRGLTYDMPGLGNFKLEGLKIDKYKAGNLGAFVLTGLETTSPQAAKIELGRFAILGLKIPQLLRWTGKMSGARMGVAQAQPAQQVAAMLQLLEGIEIDRLSVPGKTGLQPVAIETFKASWGPFVGDGPIAGSLTFNVTVPVGPNEPAPMSAFNALGMKQAGIKFDGAWNWQEAAQTFAAGPFKLDIQDLFSASGAFQLGSVSREAIAAGPQYWPVTSSGFKVGPAVVTLQDLGLAKLIESDPQLSLQKKEVMDGLKFGIGTLPPDKPDVTAAMEGLLNYLGAPKGRLRIDLTPKAATSLGQLLSQGGAAPDRGKQILETFNIKVATEPAP
jgi:hypothetical protein